MINVISNTAKRRYWVEYNQGLIRFERNFYRRIWASLKRQYRAVAKAIREDNIDRIDWIIDDYDPEMYRIYVEEFQRIGVVYNENVQRRIPEKQVDTTFWNFFFGWSRRYATRKVVQVSETTKNILRNILETLKADGWSNALIAKYIYDNTEILTQYRAARITRTEVHTGVNTAIHESVYVTGQAADHEWLAAMDTRTRQPHIDADGERVPMDEPFVRTGEALMYPGDPAGSAWNIISCRCLELFHTRSVA